MDIPRSPRPRRHNGIHRRRLADYAPQFARKIAEAAQRLAEFPLSGRRVPELDLERVREVVFHNYRIIYEPRAEGVVILAVMHGAMYFGTMAERRGWNLS